MYGLYFCNIINGDIPNYTVYEDDHMLAFLDINPCAKGHTVLIPKVHAKTLLDLPDVEVNYILPAVKKIQALLQEKLSPDGFNVGLNHGKAGGQAVPHLHIHILPRFEGDGGTNMHAIVSNPGDISVEKVYKLIQ